LLSAFCAFQFHGAKYEASAQALPPELQGIRRAGIAFDRGESREGLMTAAAPVHWQDQVVAALSVSGPEDSVTTLATGHALRSSARMASRRLLPVRLMELV
jgi:DNA-binding IclR family transcriptional regulator